MIDEIGNMLLNLKVAIKFLILSRRKSERARQNIFKLLAKKDTKACFFFFKKLFRRAFLWLLVDFDETSVKDLLWAEATKVI